MGPVLEGLGVLGGLGGGGPLVDVSDKKTDVHVDPNIDVSTHTQDRHDTTDSHNITTTIINQVVQEEHHTSVHPPSSGGHKPSCDPHVAAMQQRLQDEGYDPGPIDGIMGPRTMAAMDAEQRGHLKHHDNPNSVADDDTYGSHHLSHQHGEPHHAHHDYPVDPDPYGSHHLAHQHEEPHHAHHGYPIDPDPYDGGTGVVSDTYGSQRLAQQHEEPQHAHHGYPHQEEQYPSGEEVTSYDNDLYT
jgi:hypothetical protein